MKKYLILLSLLFLGGPLDLFAQSESESAPSAWQAMDSNQLTLLIILGVVLGVIVLMLILMIYLMSFMATVLKKENPTVVATGPSWLETFKERFVTGKVDKAFGSEEKAKVMVDHSYDGITELDNFMPPWLQYVFIGTVVYGIGYFVFYTVLGTGLTGVEEYQEELRVEAIASEIRQASNLASIDENSVTFDESAEALASGKSIFEGNCVACHAQDGGGGVGPNLTDAYWLHGGGIADIFKVIKYGIIEKGMVPWEDQLTPSEIQSLSSYVLTLAGTAPAIPKAPQGEIYEKAPSDDPAPSVTDSTLVAFSN
jgi:cytochrome c oxidase cbb3-type subunit 3